jgi:hypothetical protein
LTPVVQVQIPSLPLATVGPWMSYLTSLRLVSSSEMWG